MIDFSSILNKASKKSDSWTHQFPEVANYISNYFGADIDYDNGTENWARFIRRSDVILYLCVKYPIAITCLDGEGLFLPESVEFVQVDGFGRDIFSCDTDVIARSFGDQSIVRLSALEKKYYSFEEIWWSTVT